MQESAQRIMQSIEGEERLALFAQGMAAWLIADLNRSDEAAPDFTESRARALLRAADVIDDPTLHTFNRLMENETAVRVALSDLLSESGLAEAEQVSSLVYSSPGRQPEGAVPWLPLAIAAFAWKSSYPLHQLDPASPPEIYSPAGQALKRAAYFIRQQVQRSATERDKLGRKLAFAGARLTPSLDDLHPEQPIAPLPPHFRSPVPVRYPEVARDTVHVEPDEAEEPQPGPSRTEPITITDEDLPAERQQPPTSPSVTTMPPIRITSEQVKPETPATRTPPVPATPAPRSTVAMPSASAEPRSGFTDAVRQMFGRDREPMKTTRLRVVVQEYPDGPGLYGLQVKVSCPGIKSFVAGATNREGRFLCELPVRVHSGLTYNVDITWPRDFDGDTERKSITLNADRTEFTLPFYRRLKA